MANANVGADAYNSFLQANVQVYVLLLFVKPIVISVVLALTLASPKKAVVAAYAPSLCDFSHLTPIPFKDRGWIQQFLRVALLTGEGRGGEGVERSLKYFFFAISNDNFGNLANFWHNIS